MDANAHTLFGLSVQCAPDLDSALEDFDQAFLATRRPGFSAALNAEKLFLSQKDQRVFDLLNAAHFRYMDGIGAVWAAEYKYRRAFTRLPGVELWLHLVKRSAERGLKIAVIGASEEVNRQAVEILRVEHGIDVAYRHDGYFENDQRPAIAEALKAHDIAFTVVAMGSPRQENFSRAMIEMGVASFFFGVGGSLDVLTRKVKRAPRLLRENRLEWFYRLLQEPKRIGRQVRLFPYLMLVLRRKM